MFEVVTLKSKVKFSSLCFCRAIYTGLCSVFHTGRIRAVKWTNTPWAGGFVSHLFTAFYTVVVVVVFLAALAALYLPLSVSQLGAFVT